MNRKKRMTGVTVLCLMLCICLTGCAQQRQEIAGNGQESGPEKIVTDEQAVTAIREYCHVNNPDLEDIENAGEYPVYWDVESATNQEIVVLFRSYTGAQIRYYIDRISGNTYVTEYVPGITDEEERTDEEFSVWDYLKQ